MADNLPPSSADVTESGSLNLPEPPGHHRPVMGLLYLLCISYLFGFVAYEILAAQKGFSSTNFFLIFVDYFSR
jgi:hypothetical protein